MVYGEMLDQSRSVTSSFAAADAGAPSFTVTEGGNSGLGGTLELGLTIDLTPNVFDLDYAYDHSASGLRTHSLAFEYQRRFGRSATFAAGIRQDFSGSGASDIAASAEYRLRF